MSAYQQLASFCESHLTPKAPSFRAVNPELKGDTTSISLVRAPKDNTDESLADCARENGVNVTRTIKYDGRGTEKRPNETATGDKAAALALFVRRGAEVLTEAEETAAK